MMKKAALIALLLFTPFPAHAEPIPDYILNKDYDNCIKGASQDPDGARHCECMRDTMRKEWSLDDYGDMVMAQLKNPNQPPEKLQMLAKSCFAKTQQ